MTTFDAAQAYMLPTAAGDIGSLLKNAAKQAETWGGLFLGLLGVVALLWGGWMLFRKVTANQQQQQQTAGWTQIILTLLVGGALVGTGGYGIIKGLGESGEDTLKKLSEGTIVISQSVGTFAGR